MYIILISKIEFEDLFLIFFFRYMNVKIQEDHKEQNPNDKIWTQVDRKPLNNL